MVAESLGKPGTCRGSKKRSWEVLTYAPVGPIMLLTMTTTNAATKPAAQPLPPPRPMMIVQGRGTPRERRYASNVMLYPTRIDGEIRWTTIPSR